MLIVRSWNMKQNYPMQLTFELSGGANITDSERKLALTLCGDLNFHRISHL